MDISCSSCGCDFPPEGLPYICPTCGGLYDFHVDVPFNPAQVDPSQPGIWRYRHTFGVPPAASPISLGEGNTPLLWAEVMGRKIAFKCEFLNPSGSFKDRGSTIIVTWLLSRGITDAMEDSSGNAGASLAAYAARSGIKARVFVPQSASGPKCRQIEAYGAELVPVPGSRTDVAEAARGRAEEGFPYASHAYLPFNLPGYATAAYEMYEQLGNKMPGSIILPAGQGGLLLGLVRGFDALRKGNVAITDIPMIIGVQARACAPIWALFSTGSRDGGSIFENRTLAEGVRVRYPLRGEAVADAVMASHGCMCAVDEDEILPGRAELAQMGFYVEPTSAIVWPALLKHIRDIPDPVVVVLTGSGYKYE